MSTTKSDSGEPGKSAGDAKVSAPKTVPTSPPEMRLKRFLYLSEPRLSFITGNPEQHGHFTRESLDFIEELLTSPDNKLNELFFNIIEIVSGENLLPRRENLFYVLAMAASCDSATPDIRTRVYRTVSLIQKSDEDYFAFIRYFTLERKNPPSGLNKSISRFYVNKEPLQLARDVVLFQGYKGWKHKDLIKLSHANTSVKSTFMIMTYILFGLEKAQSNNDSSEECQKVLEILTNACQYRKANDEKKVLELLPKLKSFTHYQLHPDLHKSFPIWNVIYERFTMQNLLSKLLFFYKNDFFKKEEFLKKICERVINAEFIRESKIHPTEVFIAIRNFEKGGKPKDPKLVNFLDEEEEKKQAKQETAPDYVKPNFSYIESTKCPALVTALYKTLALSYANVPALGKRYMITIEVSEDMNKPCLSNKNVSCLEAAVVLALSISKSEKNVTIGVFNGAEITQIAFDKGCNFVNALTKVKEAAHEYVAYGQPIDAAAAKKKQVDVFLNLVHNLIPRQLPKGIVCNPAPALERYHKQKGSPNTKLILHSLNRANGNYYDNRHTHILNLHGFDEKIAPLIFAFVTDKF